MLVRFKREKVTLQNVLKNFWFLAAARVKAKKF